MIEPCPSEGIGIMAHRAILGRWQMAAVLDCRYGACTIVARGAVIDDASVIEHRGRKGARYVTDTTILSGRDVASVFLSRGTGSTITVTFCAIIHPAGMIEDAIGEIVTNTMTHPTIGSCDRMILRFP